MGHVVGLLAHTEGSPLLGSQTHPSRTRGFGLRVGLTFGLSLGLASLLGCGGKGEEAGGALIDSRLQMGLSFLQDGDVEAGLDQLRAMTAETGGGPRPGTAPSWLPEAVEHLLQWRALGAADSMLALLGPADGRPPYHRYLTARLAALRGDESEALRLYEGVRGGNELMAKATEAAAILHRSNGRHDAALQSARRGLTVSPGNERLGNLVVSSLLDLQQPAEALAAATKLPVSAERRTFEGAAHLALGDVASARAALEEARRVHPKSTRVQYLLGQVYIKEGVATQAAQLLAPLANAEPPYQDSQAFLAEAYRSMGRTAMADSLAGAFELHRVRRDANALRTAGLKMLHAGDLEGAITPLRQAQTVDPNDGNLPNDLGAVFARLKRYDEAEREFLRAAVLRPDDPAVQRNLAQLYELSGNAQARDAALERLRDMLARQENR